MTTTDDFEYEKTWEEQPIPWIWRHWRTILILNGTILLLGWTSISGALWWMGRDLPDLSTLANYRPWRITQVLSQPGHVVMEIAEQRRKVVPLKDMPKHLIQAVVSAEDSRFFKHKGLSYTGIIRAFWKNLWRPKGHPMQGGSTITQQVVKTFLLSPKQTYRRKLREALLSRRLEQNLTKQEILFLYLNQIDFGQGCYGVAEAARFYFGKKVSQLTLGESAILAGIPKHPARYNPVHSLADTKRRRGYVLRMMYENRYISRNQYLLEKARPVVSPKPHPPKEFQKDDFTQQVVRRSLRFLQTQQSRRYPNQPSKASTKARNLLLRGGLKIETTLVPDAQRLANNTLKQGLASLEEKWKWKGTPLQAGMVVLEPRTRRVMALVEGRYISNTRPSRATSTPQPMGTLLQPILYAAAIASRKFTAASTLHSGPYTFVEGKKKWRITSPSSPRPNRPIRLREALKHQVTSAAARALAQLKPASLKNTLSNLGIPTSSPSFKQLLFGQVKATPMQVANAFATLAAQGAYDHPALINRIQTHDGKSIYERLPNPQRRIPSGVAYTTLHMMKDSLTLRTGISKIKNSSIFGYTGVTLQRNHSWFVACTPTLCLSLWVGAEEPKPLPKNAENTALSLGMRWLRRFMKTPSGKRHHHQAFSVSDDVVFTTIDPVSGLLMLPNHPNALREIFLYQTQPTQYATTTKH